MADSYRHAIVAACTVLFAATLVVTPVTTAMFDVVLVVTVIAACLAARRRSGEFAYVTVAVRIGLLVAATRISAVTMLEYLNPPRRGITAGIGDLVAGGNAVVGAAACAAALCLLLAYSWRRSARVDAMLAIAALPLVIGTGVVLASLGDLDGRHVMRGIPFACGAAIALGVPALVRASAPRPLRAA